jgi:hypothetical protein
MPSTSKSAANHGLRIRRCLHQASRALIARRRLSSQQRGLHPRPRHPHRSCLFSFQILFAAPRAGKKNHSICDQRAQAPVYLHFNISHSTSFRARRHRELPTKQAIVAVHSGSSSVIIDLSATLTRRRPSVRRYVALSSNRYLLISHHSSPLSPDHRRTVLPRTARQRAIQDQPT